MRVQFWLKFNLESTMTTLGPTCTGCCVRKITYNAVTSGTHTHAHTHTHTPQLVQGSNEYNILWDFNIQTDKVIESRLPDRVCINKQKRVSDYCLCNPWGPKYSYQITEKN